jgi:hypothetical protein
MKDNKKYANGATLPNDYTGNGYCYMIVRFPNSPLWRQMYRGLIYHPTRYYFWRLDGDKAHSTVKIAKKVFEDVIMTTELDYNLRELQFTLKAILAKISNDNEIKWYIDKPNEPTRDSVTNEWVIGQNTTLTDSKKSVFKVSNTLTESSITEVLSIGLLEDVTGLLPDVNPFNLESKLTYIYNAFYAGLDINPLSDETIFDLIRRSLNRTGLLADKSWFDYINTNISTSFNQNINDNLASDSYFKLLHNWFDVAWPLFQATMDTLKDCICATKDFIQTISNTLTTTNERLYNGLMSFDGNPLLNDISDDLGKIDASIQALELNPTITNSPNNNITVNACCDDMTNATKDIADAIKDLVDVTKDNGTTTTDNGDGTYSSKPNLPDYPDMPTDKPSSTIDRPLNKPTSIKKSNSHNAKCGFVFYYLNQIAEMCDQIADLITYWSPLIDGVGTTTLAGIIVGTESAGEIPFTGGLSLTKTPAEFAIVKSALDASVLFDVALLRTANLALRDSANTIACSQLGTNVGKNIIMSTVSATFSGNPFIGLAMNIASIVFDYSGSNADNSAIIDMSDYAQYCPCPETEGLFSGTWWNNHVGTNERYWYFSSNTTNVYGNHTSKDLFGTIFKFDIITCLIDTNNPNVANGTKVQTSQGSSQISSANFSLNEANTELYYNNETYIRVG